MCNECKNQTECPFKESYDFLCKPLVESINDGLDDDGIFAMELKCKYRNKTLPYTVDNNKDYSEIDAALDKILHE